MTDFPLAKLAELVGGDLEHENDHLQPHAGLVTDEALHEVVAFCEANLEALDLDAETFAETALGGQLLGRAATARATETVQAAPPGPRASFFSGVTEKEVALSKVQVLQRMLGIIRPAGRILVWTGGTNHGKTNTALLWLELAESDMPELAIATNMTSLSGPEYELVESQPELLAFLEDHPAEQKAVWLDEASSHMTGYAGDRRAVEDHMRPVVRATAKHHARLMFGAHRLKDAHPTIRAMPNCRFVENEKLEDETGTPEEYLARVYDDVGPDGNLVGDPVVLRDLPETSWSYDPDESTTWAWE